MRMHPLNYSVMGLLLVAMQVLAAGQNAPAPGGGSTGTSGGSEETRSAPAPALSGVVGIDSPLPEEDSSGTLPAIPAMLGGARLSLALRSESERSNYLRAGLNVGATYDDNTLLTPHQTLSDTTYSVFPNISMEQVRPRMTWKLGYAGGLTVNERLTNRNQGSHDLNFDSQFRLSPHVNLHVAENFLLTSGFFDSGNGAGLGIGGGGSNGTLNTPLSRQRSSSTVVEADYHFALRDIAGASGSFYDLHFDSVAQGFTLNNSRTASGSAFWLHGFGRDWLGVDYTFQRVKIEGTSDNPGGETRTHSILAVDTVRLSNRFTISAFGGPEYSENQGLVATGGGTVQNFNEWSFAGGADIGWQQDHTSVTAGYSRRVSDGGGLLGVVRVQGLHGEVREQLRPGWAASLAGSYGNNKSLTIPVQGNADRINAASLGASIERNLGKSLALRAGYVHEFQEQFGGQNTDLQGPAHRNRFSLTLGYQWSRPLGR
jgi:hypothetical protein